MHYVGREDHEKKLMDKWMRARHRTTDSLLYTRL